MIINSLLKKFHLDFFRFSSAVNTRAILGSTLVLTLSLAVLSCEQETKQSQHNEKLQAQLNDSLSTKIETAYDLGLLKGFSVAVVDQDDVLKKKKLEKYAFKQVV